MKIEVLALSITQQLRDPDVSVTLEIEVEENGQSVTLLVPLSALHAHAVLKLLHSSAAPAAPDPETFSGMAGMLKKSVAPEQPRIPSANSPFGGIREA